MRVDAAEFVPIASSALVDEAEAGFDADAAKTLAAGSSLTPDSPEFKPASNGVLSADTPEFVPGALHAGDQAGYWPQEGYTGGVNTYGVDMQYYVDEETFLTPQLLPERSEDDGQTFDAASDKRETNGTETSKSNESKGEVEEWPTLGEMSCRKGKKGGKGGKVSAGASTQESKAADDASASTSAGSSSSSGWTVGAVSIEGRQLQWTLTSDDCMEGSGGSPRTLEEVPQGESLRSAKFCVAGVVLQLAFFPSGTALTGEGESAVAVLCEEKTKLKFELFFNGRRSGTKVMLGQKFSNDFRKPEMSGSQSVVIGIEVYSNLLVAGFY
eukprot:gb/GFBE01046475.1/.p1 GENE.gb/GFBE01046475.1/~~gb/GFBE01046475.1/.p1  ORF type:complete len:327 (+),score=71.40 gb/GFBE01046475.1/:1-981(+)